MKIISSAIVRFVTIKDKLKSNLTMQNWYFVSSLLSLLAISLSFLAIGFTTKNSNKEQQNTKEKVQDNSKSIYVGCKLLANAVADSYSTQGSESTKILIDVIKRNMTPNELKRFREAIKDPQRITIPDCTEISKNPDKFIKSNK